MSLKDQLDKAFGKNKMLEVAVERLHPPMAPKPIDRDNIAIDYETIARSSEFQRFIYFVLTGKTHRGKQRDLKRDVTVKMNKFRGSGMGDVINEFKDKVAKLQEKRVE